MHGALLFVSLLCVSCGARTIAAPEDTETSAGACPAGTLSSLDKNRELGVLTETAAAISKMQATFDADFAKATPR